MIRNNLICLGLMIFFVVGCSSPTCDELLDQVNSEEHKSKRSYSKFKSQIKRLEDKECLPASILDDEGVIIEERLNSLYHGEKLVTDQKKTLVDDLKRYDFNIYLENSASMWPYFIGPTMCEAAVSEIIVDAEYLFGRDNINMAFITDTVYPVKIDNSFAAFIREIEKKDLLDYTNKKSKSYANTKLADIFETVISNTKKDNIGILITDCIYSLNKEKTIDYQAAEWVLIKRAFLEAIENSNFSVYINKFYSNYNGPYYHTKVNGITNLKEQRRPYYIFMLGEKEAIQYAIKDFDIQAYPGYSDSYFISKETDTYGLDYNILNKGKIGSFKFVRGTKKEIKNIKRSKRGENKGVFSFSIGINNSDMILENAYLTNPENYSFPPNYKLKVNTSEGNGKYTHILSLTTKKPRKQDISISLKRKTPDWVSDTNSDDDSVMKDSELEKTYGFEQFVKGIERAYDLALKKQQSAGTENFYTITVKTDI